MIFFKYWVKKTLTKAILSPLGIKRMIILRTFGFNYPTLNHKNWFTKKKVFNVDGKTCCDLS